MISAANFHSCFGRWNSTGRYLNFNEIVVRQLRVGHSDYRFMRINEMAEMDGGCWRCRGDGEADVERSMRCSMAASSRATSPGAARRRDMSRYAPLSLDGPRCLRAAEFVRINSAELTAINFVGEPAAHSRAG
ncbi:hypothetical protein DF018_09370 [Burkholderia cenocepacia]|nr:hypothetical protein DF133_20880 [Burkholderia cenocepacia]RQV16554.1 hypothetical protein DF132_26500 [Burkholderia cenocepacia]RQV72795.1 hypothetical protein DF018_09370 [Burkholderia cenocepacia]